MLALDWQCFEESLAMTTLAKAGISNPVDLSFDQILKGLRLGSNATPQDTFPVETVANNTRVNLTDCVNKLRSHDVVRDVIGGLKLYPSRIYFLTLVNPNPRQYLSRYIEVAERVIGQYPGFRFTVWLEDRLSVIKNGWDEDLNQESLKAFKDYFIRENPDCDVLVSSEVSSGIPVSFSEAYLTRVSGADLISILPYHLRSPERTRVLDVIHFAWMCYLSFKCSGIHLSGITSKRHYQIFREMAGRGLTVFLFKLGSEATVEQGQK